MERKKAQIMSFMQLGDDRGKLVAIEGNNDIPFEISRIFYIYGTQKDVVRGQHANRRSEFVLVNVNGTSKVKVDYGVSQEVFELNEPYTALFLPNMVWKDMYDFSDDSVLLVLSNEKYDADEYIRDYKQYLDEIKE